MCLKHKTGCVWFERRYNERCYQTLLREMLELTFFSFFTQPGEWNTNIYAFCLCSNKWLEKELLGCCNLGAIPSWFSRRISTIKMNKWLPGIKSFNFQVRLPESLHCWREARWIRMFSMWHRPHNKAAGAGAWPTKREINIAKRNFFGSLGRTWSMSQKYTVCRWIK